MLLLLLQAVPRHLRGELAYCTQCKQDLEETLLVYFLVRPGGGGVGEGRGGGGGSGGRGVCGGGGEGRGQQAW